MIQNQVKTKFIQLETSLSLHEKIRKVQALFSLHGDHLTIPKTCTKLLELAADKILNKNKELTI